MKEQIAGVGIEEGRITYRSLEFEGMPIPLVIAAGNSDGPVLLAMGMQHATEFSGPGAVDRVLNEIDTDLLSGVLVCLPMVNPIHAYLPREEHRKLWSKPETNMNRQWPGDINSENQVERLAGFIWDNVVTEVDAAIDLHCCRRVDPRFAACLEGHKKSEEFSAILGLDAIDLQTPESYNPRQFHIVASEKLDIPAILLESHPGGFQVREAVEVCSGAVTRAMVYMGMLSGGRCGDRISAGTAMFRRSGRNYDLKTAKGGLLGIRRWPGERVHSGEPVAEVRSLETFEVVEQIVSPVNGAVGFAGHSNDTPVAEPGVTVADVQEVRYG